MATHPDELPFREPAGEPPPERNPFSEPCPEERPGNVPEPEPSPGPPECPDALRRPDPGVARRQLT